MNERYFNYNSTRAKKARTAHHFGHQDLEWLLLICGWVMLAAGVGFVWALQAPWGWIMAGLSGPFWMAGNWSNYLQKLPPHPKAETIDDVLEPGLLGILPAEHSPQQLADLVLHANGGRFMAARFGLGSGFLEPLSSKSPADSAKVWQEAERIRQQIGASELTAATVSAALVRSIPSVDQYLAQAQVDQDDIMAGAAWYAHLQECGAGRQPGRRQNNAGANIGPHTA